MWSSTQTVLFAVAKEIDLAEAVDKTQI